MTHVHKQGQLPGAETALAAAGEGLLLGIYASQDAIYHWFVHFLVGGGTALAGLALLTAYRRRTVPVPALWVLGGHVFALVPDLLFAGGLAHRRWMDVFLGHISSHYVPGGLWTLYAAFLAVLAGYLLTLTDAESSPSRRAPSSDASS